MEQNNTVEKCYSHITKKFQDLVDNEISLWVESAEKSLIKSKDKLIEKYTILCGSSFSEAKGTLYLGGCSISNYELLKVRGYIKSLEAEGAVLNGYHANDPALRGGTLYPCATIKKIADADKSWSACICLDETGEHKYCNYEKCLSASDEERKEEFKSALVKKIADKHGLDYKKATKADLSMCGKLQYAFSRKACKHLSYLDNDSTAFFGALSIEGITREFLVKLIEKAKMLGITFDSIKVRIGESTCTSTKARGFYTFQLKDGELTDENIPISATTNTRMFSIKGKNVFASYDPFMEISYTLKVDSAKQGE